ncbi:MAG: pyridoxine 5'-phosphate synthase [Deltaproteobacteria bacterium]|nr:pyridoxine 5'-phosphate synthase [Deltaproteobacteria bacterium]MBW2601346.1 pyridoxine 5'-phosphate synthase [Deltaproteobacteria bacterium]OEU44224.1 MAG: pyridoxine 5'-phosphate synthase [Desulfobacterales bacterium S7086C20]
MAQLAVNVDHVATLRQARGINLPDPVTAAAIVELAGADGVVVHLREDRRHIQDRDVRILRQTVKTKLILEMAATTEMIGIAKEIKPDLVTLVPEKRQELTTEGGLDLHCNEETVAEAINSIHKQGTPVSLFVNPDPDQIELARKIAADCVEIHTGTFCDAIDATGRSNAFSRIAQSAKLAHKLGLEINAGHGLGYHTIKSFKGLSEINEFSIGHSIIARAVMVGLARAVREMVELIKEL